MRVAPIDLFHRTGETASPEIHRIAAQTVQTKSPHWVSPPAKPAGMSTKIRRRVGRSRVSLRGIGGEGWPKQSPPVPDPAFLLGELANLLRPGGILVLEVPNFGADDARRLGADRIHANSCEHHVNSTPDSLTKLVTAAGLQVEHAVQFSSSVYESPERTLELRNAAPLEHVAWPSPDLMRIIARAPILPAPS